MDDRLSQLIGREVVIDAVSQFVFVGRLTSAEGRYFVLEDADVHDLRDSNSTRELYVLESKLHGVRRNRKQVLVDSTQIAGLSALDDVVE